MINGHTLEASPQCRANGARIPRTGVSSTPAVGDRLTQRHVTLGVGVREQQTPR